MRLQRLRLLPLKEKHCRQDHRIGQAWKSEQNLHSSYDMLLPTTGSIQPRAYGSSLFYAICTIVSYSPNAKKTTQFARLGPTCVTTRTCKDFAARRLIGPE